MHQDHHLSLPIDGMTCASCVGRVERALSAVAGVESVQVNLATERADVVLAQGAKVAALEDAVKDAGYRVDASKDSLELSVAGMTCASCVGRVEKALLAVPGVRTATASCSRRCSRPVPWRPRACLCSSTRFGCGASSLRSAMPLNRRPVRRGSARHTRP